MGIRRSCLARWLGWSASCRRVMLANLGSRGGGLGWWEPCWCAGELVAQVLAGDHGHEGGVVAGEQCAMMVVRVSFWRRSVPRVGGREIMLRGNPCPVWAVAAASMDVASFLKAPLQPLSRFFFVLRVKTHDPWIRR